MHAWLMHFIHKHLPYSYMHFFAGRWVNYMVVAYSLAYSEHDLLDLISPSASLLLLTPCSLPHGF